MKKTIIIIFLFQMSLFAQDLLRYTPEWIKDGFVTGGSTHEPWIFFVRRGTENFNTWQKKYWEYRQTEEYIKALAESGVTVYHIFSYKGYGWQAEKEHMRLAAKAAKIAHKYGLKVDTYIQWNSMFYETFFKEVPEAETDLWYQLDETGKPSTLDYGYAPYRRAICFNSDAYMEYYKEKILRFAVDSIKTDFIHFDNFGLHHPKEVQYNPQTINAFRKYLNDKYPKEERMDRFGFDDFSFVLPPIWNYKLDPLKMKNITDPIMQEFCDFRVWTISTRLKECITFVRSLNKEIAIEVNGIGLNVAGIWNRGINPGNILPYLNAAWTEGSGSAEWKDGKIEGKWRFFKVGRSTNTYFLSYKDTPRALAEALSINRTIAWALPRGSESAITDDKLSGIPVGENKKYVDFWNNNKNLYSNVVGAENVAVLRSYPSMAYSLIETHKSVMFVEDKLYQNHILYDIIFDEQLSNLNKYDLLVLANQESLADSVIEKIYLFVEEGGKLVLTEKSGIYNHWRRIRQNNAFQKMLGNGWDGINNHKTKYGKGNVHFLKDILSENNDTDLVTAVKDIAAEKSILQFKVPEWVGVSCDKKDDELIVHFVNYKVNSVVSGAKLISKQKIVSAEAISPDRDDRINLSFNETTNGTIINLPDIDVYEVVILKLSIVDISSNN
ncbi:MAG: beta-galactosidase trimerization domain-containing protein [Melioribacteraceae bacterium]|nr:beta-galactosidase trimerization domain-containing protein [Melioribacteraceae bacterium]